MLRKRHEPPHSSENRHQRGFSFVEMVIASALFSLVLLAVYFVYESNMTTAAWGNKKVELQQNARAAFAIMEREIRMAGYDPSTTGQAAIQSNPLSASDLIFAADIDGDGVTDKVQYTFTSSSGTISRTVWRWNGVGWTLVTATPDLVAEGVSSLAFAYCDGSNVCNPQPAPAAVRRITVSITASGAAGGKTQVYNFTSDVRLRNL